MYKQERYEELVEQHACNDYAVLDMARMIAELEWQVEDLKRDIEDWKHDLEVAEGRLSS